VSSEESQVLFLQTFQLLAITLNLWKLHFRFLLREDDFRTFILKCGLSLTGGLPEILMERA
jgi:hypothetical protein